MERYTLIFGITSLILALIFSISEGRDSRRGAGGSAYHGDDIFLKGKYLEVGLNPASTFGSREIRFGGTRVPSGFHNYTNRLGVVVDYAKDGWTVGSPPKSGELLASNLREHGFHLSWTSGGDGVQPFNQMPLFPDDDDADESFLPPRGTISLYRSIYLSIHQSILSCSDLYSRNSLLIPLHLLCLILRIH